jgi:hypothetical protein
VSFEDVFSSPDYITSNDTVNEQRILCMWKERLWPNFVWASFWLFGWKDWGNPLRYPVRVIDVCFEI